MARKQPLKHRSDQIADHYGFDLINIKETNFSGNPDIVSEEERVKVLQYYKKENGDLKKESPAKMFFHNKPVLKDKNLKKKKARMGLDVLGVHCGIAEATAIKTAMDILKEEGYKDLFIEINSIGDKDSVKQFEKELITFYRQNSESLKKVDLKKLTHGKVLDLFTSSKEHLAELNEDAPCTVNYLSDDSASHLKEVLEYIEEMKIDYVVKGTLIGEKNYYSKIIFQIKTTDKKTGEEIVLARGGRYDDVAATVAKKRKVSAVGLQMNFDKKQKIKNKPNDKVSVYMVKLGFKAKLKSLEVAEILKKVNVPFKHDIAGEKISDQLKAAIDNDANYSIIIGQKEANENKVLIRDMVKNAQKEVSIDDLEKYLKKISK